MIREGNVDYTSSVLTVLPGRAIVSPGFIRIYVRPSIRKYLSMSDEPNGKEGGDIFRHDCSKQGGIDRIMLKSLSISDHVYDGPDGSTPLCSFTLRFRILSSTL